MKLKHKIEQQLINLEIQFKELDDELGVINYDWNVTSWQANANYFQTCNIQIKDG